MMKAKVSLLLTCGIVFRQACIQVNIAPVLQGEKGELISFGRQKAKSDAYAHSIDRSHTQDTH